MWKKLRGLVQDETGPAVIEDGLILALVAVLLISGLLLATGAISNVFGQVSDTVDVAAGTVPTPTGGGGGGGSGGGGNGGGGGGVTPTPTATATPIATPTPQGGDDDDD